MKKLFYGGDIITMEEEQPSVEAVYVEDGIIKRIGLLSDFNDLFNDNSIEVEDLKGQTLMPGFIDPHGHISMMGVVSQMANLRECTNFQEIINVLNQYKEEKQLDNDAIILGFGYDHNFLEEKAHPTKDVLNQVSTENPIFISHASGHVGCANDVTLTLAGINESSPDVEGGFIGRVENSLEPNGYLEEGSMMEVNKLLNSKVQVNHEQLYTLGEKEYIKNGITTAQDGATSSDAIALFKHLAENNKLNIDIVAYPTVIENPEDMWSDDKFQEQYFNRFKIGGYKLFLDGSPQGKTAWLTEPYEGEESYCGYPWFKDEEVKAFISKAINDNVQLLTHCNGDAASDQLLTQYKLALSESNNGNKDNLRPVMIHCQTARDDQLDEMKNLAMIPSVFNAHTYYWGDVHLENLGQERGSRISPAKSAFDKGLIVNFHQDAPVVNPNMIQTIWSAVNRITRKGVKIGEDECVTISQALKAVTINAAYAYFEEDIKGSIQEGKVADFVIVDKNPLKIDKLDLNTIKVMETIKDGEAIYKRKDEEVKMN